MFAAAHGAGEWLDLTALIISDGPVFAVIRISPEEKPRHLPPRDGAYVTERFRHALGLVEN